jgi:PAS domain S-box-containing protein
MLQRPRQEIFSSIVREMPEGVIFLDDEDVIRYCNPAAERIRKVHADKIVGRLIYTIHPPHAHPRLRELLTSLKTGIVATSNRVIKAQKRYFENTYSGVRDADGEYLGTLLISRDITEKKRLSEENLQLKNPLNGNDVLVARSEKMRQLLDLVDSVAELDSTVLVTGENGTGKERVVERLHRNSLRSDKPLVRINCAALPENLIESELFGHQRGSFTGATEDRQGKFVLADGGTLFLDEIAELPLTSQSKLLRAIQERMVQPVGGRREVLVDVRIVVATNRDLGAEVAAGNFRQDLFYRLNVIHFDVPPLRDRPDDILPLAELFVEQFCRQMKKPPKVLAPEVRILLKNHPLPGNVRQLKHAIERAVALGQGELLLPNDLPADLLGQEQVEVLGGHYVYTPGECLKQVMGRHERETLQQALRAHQGRKNETAASLGISRKSLWEKLHRHALDTSSVTES